MATVTMTLNPGDKPTKEQLKEIQEASQKSIVFTDDAPELTDKELHKMIKIRESERDSV